MIWAGMSQPAPAAPPNVLIIVADDLGYADLGFQGSKEIPTPHLDKLAAESIRCTSGYVPHPFCSPTRASLLTGRYQHRFGHENNPAWLPADRNAGLPLDQITFPQVMKKAGYLTGAVGKWHLGAHPDFHPNRRGFDEYWGLLGGGHMYFPTNKGGVEYTIPLDRNGKEAPFTNYLTAQIGMEAAAFVRRHAGAVKPWLLYLAFNAPHTPLQAPEDWLAKLAAIKDERRRAYAAMVAAMDDAIGEVLQALQSSGQERNTLLFFISDNGGPNLPAPNSPAFTDNSPLRGHKGAVYEGGIRVPFLVKWPARLKGGRTYDAAVSAMDFLATAAAAAGAPLPNDRPMDGVNLLPYLAGEQTGAPHEFLFWRSGGPGGNYAARMGPWKYVRLKEKEPELYNLTADIGETKNVAADHPQVLAQMRAAVAAWDQQTIAPIFESPRPAKAKKKAENK